MSSKEKIILIGGGGHCKSVIDVIEEENRFEIAGIIDVKEKIGLKVLNYPIIASEDELHEICKEYRYFFITVGQIKSALLRIKLFDAVKKEGGSLPVIISPKAHVSKYSKLDDGTIVMHYSMINASAIVGKNCIINTGAVIEHDSIIGDNCHISTGAYINGNCKVGENSFLGSGSITLQGISIGNNNIIGAGSVIRENTKASALYAGNPATIKKSL